MSTDDEFGIIQTENIWEVSYNSPVVLGVWLLIHKYLKILSKAITSVIKLKEKLNRPSFYYNKFVSAS